MRGALQPGGFDEELLAKFKLRSTDDVYGAAAKAEFRSEEPAEASGAANAFSKY